MPYVIKTKLHKFVVVYLILFLIYYKFCMIAVHWVLSICIPFVNNLEDNLFNKSLYFCSLPRNMISTLVNMVSSMDHDKTKECLLCEQILSELLPRNQDDLGSDFYPSSSHQKGTSSANCLLLYLMQV